MKKNRIALTTALLVATTVVVAPAAPALAASNFQISWTKIGIYPRSAPDMGASHVGEALSDGTWISVECETLGTYVESDAAYTNIWERLTNGSFLPNAFVETGADGWTPGVPNCDAISAAPPVNPGPQTPAAPPPPVDGGAPQTPAAPHPAPAQPTAPAPASAHYDRDAAVAWARAHYQDLDVLFIANCTVFASGVLAAGGLPLSDKWQPLSTNGDDQASGLLYVVLWGKGPTKRWAAIDFLKNYLVDELGIASITELSSSDGSAGGAQPGDLIAYDWGHEDDPGVLDHVAVVTGVDANGHVAVAQKQDNQLDRTWYWSNNGNDSFDHTDPGTRYYLIHIN